MPASFQNKNSETEKELSIEPHKYETVKEVIKWEYT